MDAMDGMIGRRVALGALGGGAAAAAGLGGIASAQALRPFTAITPFGFIADFGELMNAHSAGHFRAQGLQSTVLGGQGTGQAVTQLIAGQAKFTRASGLDIARAVYAANAPLVVISEAFSPSYEVGSAATGLSRLGRQESSPRV